jgi:hypothetical protein
LMLVVNPTSGLDPSSSNQIRPAPVRQKVVVVKGQETQVTMTLDLSK